MAEVVLPSEPGKFAPAAAQGRRVTLTTVVVGAALAAGIVFRLFYPGTIEFGHDERFSFDHVTAVLNGGPWPALGMTMSIGGPNPGMSVWIFILLGLICRPTSPVGLAEAVQVLNIVALVGFVAFAIYAVPRREREPWLWAAALWAVNPLAIVYERKIWPPSTLPVFMVAMLAGWWYRRSWWGSFVFALIAVVCGQIHPTAIFLALALAAWALLEDRRSFRWSGLATGAVIGILPAAHWLLTYYASGNSLHKLRPPMVTFYWRWLTTPFGYGPDHILGPVEFPRFLGWPEIGGTSTHVVLAIYAVIVGLALAIVIPAALRVAISGRPSLRWIVLGDTAAGCIVRAAFFGFGTILTVLTIRGGGLYPHYMIVITPIMTLWVALVAAFADGGALRQRGRALLTALCLCDAAVVILLFSYIHAVGDIHGEFGPSLEWQGQNPRWRDRSDQRLSALTIDGAQAAGRGTVQMPAYQS